MHIGTRQNVCVFGVATICVIAGIAIATYWKSGRSNVEQEPLSSITWIKYTSSKLGVSFEYPVGWTIEHDLKNTKNNTRLCPSKEESTMRETGSMADCIELFPRDELLELALPTDDTMIFADLSRYINDPPYIYDPLSNTYLVPDYDFKIVEVFKERGSITDLRALYRFGTTDMLGLRQSSCPGKGLPDCLPSFIHVLDSLRFY